MLLRPPDCSVILLTTSLDFADHYRAFSTGRCGRPMRIRETLKEDYFESNNQDRRGWGSFDWKDDACLDVTRRADVLWLVSWDGRRPCEGSTRQGLSDPAGPHLRE